MITDDDIHHDGEAQRLGLGGFQVVPMPATDI